MITFKDIEENSDTFRAYMEEIDARLRKLAVPIHDRPLKAFQEIARDGMSMVIGGALPHPHADQIKAWLVRRYGDRLLVDLSLGKAVILVRGDPYVLKLPRICGKWDRVVDVTKTFVGMTKELFSDLPESDQSDMVTAFVSFYEAFTRLQALSEPTRANIDTAILQMTAQSPHFGESQWASLQFAEKTLKEFITRKKAKPPHTHCLKRLLTQAEQLGLEKGLWPLLSTIQCSAGVRYDDGVSLETAVLSHHASIDLCATVAEQLDPTKPRAYSRPAAFGEVTISFAHAGDLNHIGGLLFRFRMADGSEHLLLFGATICFKLRDSLRTSIGSGRHADTRRDFARKRDFRNVPPRHPIRIFLANSPAIEPEDFLKPIKQIVGYNIDDFTNGIRCDFRAVDTSTTRLTMCSTVVNYFADYLDGGIAAGCEHGLFHR